MTLSPYLDSNLLGCLMNSDGHGHPYISIGFYQRPTERHRTVFSFSPSKQTRLELNTNNPNGFRGESSATGRPSCSHWILSEPSRSCGVGDQGRS